MSSTFTLSDDALQWLKTGERGLSSEAIFQELTGWPLNARGDSPHDPDDLRRCMLLFDSVPEFAGRIGEMAHLSDMWARLVPAWDELIALLRSEIGNKTGYAPKTYAAMKRVRGEENAPRVRVEFVR